MTACLSLALFAGLSARALTPGPAALAAGGKAKVPIVVSAGASPRVKAAARTLAEQLRRITGADFAETAGEGTRGLAVGQTGDFPALGLDAALDASGLARREQYLLRSHAQGVVILGATDLAVENAVWDFLHRIGYRQFFPGPAWEFVPKVQALTVRLDAHEKPSYYTRSIWYGFGMSEFNADALKRWQVRNRVPGGFSLKTGHAYEALIKRHQAEFDAHPEYLGLLGGKRKSSKLCISNPGLRALAARDAVQHFENDPGADSYSVEPSDDRGWCECAACAALGSHSDRALTLANAVGEAVAARYPDKFVAFYAFNLHSPPPALRAQSNVIVSVATALTRHKTPPEELLTGWSRQGVRNLGVREYFAVNTWDRGLPARSRAAEPEYLRSSIPRFHGLGARFVSAESSDNWGSTGLGYYLAARLLWDVAEASNTPALIDDFMDKAFGSARGPMAEFYAVLSAGDKPAADAALVERLYGLLARAAGMTSDAAVRARLDDLALYVRYVELYGEYRTSALGRQKAFESVLKHAYRMRERGMVDVKPMFTDLAKRDWLVRLPPGAEWSAPAPGNPLKDAAPFSRAELDALLARGPGGVQ